MFEADPTTPRLFALPPGVDFPRAVVQGLFERLGDRPPTALARVTLLANARSMEQALSAALVEEAASRGAALLPRINLVTDPWALALPHEVPEAVSPLARRLELLRVVRALLEREPGLAPEHDAFDLADSLAGLLEEMQFEAVGRDAIDRIDVAEHAAHWQLGRRFIDIVLDMLEAEGTRDEAGRLRHIIDRTIAAWEAAPPTDPLIVVGSTGSRGASRDLMKAVARLPAGAIILPGFDFDMPDHAWKALDDSLTAEDHPQFRYRRLVDELGASPQDVRPWTTAQPENTARNRLVSLALRPAPVTDQWLREGPSLRDIPEATGGVTLLEAGSPREEAQAIAIGIREAVENGQRVALVTPDRTLARQVEAALQRWRISADDSAGEPLHLTPPGRLLCQIADMLGRSPDGVALVALLKHPLVAASCRGDHLRFGRELELHLRRKSVATADPRTLRDWARGKGNDEARTEWAEWLAGAIERIAATGRAPAEDLLRAHVGIAETLAAGPGATGAGGLWDAAAGDAARAAVTTFEAAADIAGELAPADYAVLFRDIFSREAAREKVPPGNPVMIWGPIEARARRADRVILGGLNEGVWPEPARPDPWLSRQMRADAGLLLPERRLGLSAHDFQQAIAGGDVWLTRSVRDAEARTVPSRWLNRLLNLLDGLPGDGADALRAMRARGQRYLDLAQAIDAPQQRVPAAARPAPVPPASHRLTRLSVTEVQTLVRDPYAVYARRILRLSPLDGLRQLPDAPLRGTVIHKILCRFIDETSDALGEDAEARLRDIAAEVLEAEVPWPAARAMWQARIDRIAQWFVQSEKARRARAAPLARELPGRAEIPELRFTLTGTADRIDRMPDGRLVIYDYKTGKVPTKEEVKHFDRQLLLEAAMVERGAFDGVSGRVACLEYIGLGTKPTTFPLELEPDETDRTWDEFRTLLGRFILEGRPFTSRRAMQKRTDRRDYDLLARHGEWDETDPPKTERLS